MNLQSIKFVWKTTEIYFKQKEKQQFHVNKQNIVFDESNAIIYNKLFSTSFDPIYGKIIKYFILN